MRKDLDHLGEKYFHYYDQYEKIKTKYYTIGDKHDHMITALKGVSKCINSKTWVNGHSQNDKNGFQDQLLLNAGQKYTECSHLSLRSLFCRVFELSLYTGFTILI